VPAVQQTGYLGLDFAPDIQEGGARLVTKVLPKGPADGAGLRVGDVVTKLGGKELKPDTSLELLLAGTVGKSFQVAYRPRTAAGLEAERTVELVPLAAGRVNELLHDEWVSTCKRRVEEATKTKDGEVAYIHLDQMNPPNLRKFQQAVQTWASNPKIKGMILDVRNNGGGNIHGPLIQILSARPFARVTVRGRDAGVQPDTYWDRPVTLLINERSFSDAEVFPFMFREAKLGKIVGVPTAGGVIGTNDITLSDGSQFRIPRTEFRAMDGKNLEGMGIPPDILVVETPEDRRQARDPQLQKAIEVILAEVAEREKLAPPKPKEEPKAGTPSPAPPPQLKADASHPLADARKGEWVRYRVIGDAGEETLVKIAVARSEGGEVFFEKEVEKGTGAMPPFPLKMEQKGVIDLLPAFGQVLGHTVVQGKVRESDAEILDARVRWPDGAELRLQFTNAVPAYGLLRVEANGQLVVEAVEWGAPPESEAKADEAPPNPLFDAQVGEWARMKMTVPRGEFEITRRVIEVSDAEVTIGTTMHMAGVSQEQEPQKRPRTRLLGPPEGGPATFGREKRAVAGKELDCIVMTFARDGHEDKVWYCPEVPVTGAVRHERDGTVIFEILDWGKD
jgi:tricorn protease